MTPPAHELLEAARSGAGISFRDLWIDYLALGGTADPAAVRGYLGGRAAPVIEYDVLAHAINERFLDRGQNHPVPYREELP